MDEPIFGWCKDCQRHSTMCECHTDKHIYVVEFRIEIDPPGLSCQEKVRCVAYDVKEARAKVIQWALATGFIWWDERGEMTEHTIPIGPRSATIVFVEKYAENVGGLLRQVPLPEIFAHEV